MPVVTIQIREGHSTEAKQGVARAITDALVDQVGANPETLHVVIQEIPTENWALGGVIKTESPQ